MPNTQTIEFDADIGMIVGPPEAFAQIKRALAHDHLDARRRWLKQFAFQVRLNNTCSRITVADLADLAGAVERESFWDFVGQNCEVNPYDSPGTASARYGLAIAAAKDPIALDTTAQRALRKNWARDGNLDNSVRDAIKEDRPFELGMPTLTEVVERAVQSHLSNLPRAVTPAPETMLEHFALDGYTLTTFADREELGRSMVFDMRSYKVTNSRLSGDKYRKEDTYVLRYEIPPSGVGSYGKERHALYVGFDMYYNRLGDVDSDSYGDQVTRLRRQVAGKAGAMRRTMKHLQSFVSDLD